MRNLLVVLFVVFISVSCTQKPLKVFKVNNLDLKLYSDSTYTQNVNLLERTYEITGTWYGGINNGDTFVLRRKDVTSHEPIEVVGEFRYFVDGETVYFVEMSNLYTE